MVKYPEHSDYCAWLDEIGILDDGHRNCMDTLSCVAQREDDEE